MSQEVQKILRSLMERRDEKNLNGFPVIHREYKGQSGTTYIRFDAVSKAFEDSRIINKERLDKYSKAIEKKLEIANIRKPYKSIKSQHKVFKLKN